MQHLIDEEEKAEVQMATSSYLSKPLQAIQWRKSAADFKKKFAG